jgi:DNA end-binding protein Ku
MALRLVEDMADEWKPGKFKDTYRDDLLKRIKAKVKAGQTEELTEPDKDAEKPPKSADVIDLMALLKKSVEKKPARKAKRATRKRRAA